MRWFHQAFPKKPFRTATKPLNSGDAEASTNLAAIGELLSGLATDVEGSDRAPVQPQRDVLAAANERQSRAGALWDRIKHAELAEVDAQLKATGSTPITIPAADQIKLAAEPESVDKP